MIKQEHWRELIGNMMDIVDHMSEKQAINLINAIKLRVWKKKHNYLSNVDPGDDQGFCNGKWRI